ncbi:MAG: hypothetical protein EOP83_17325 [Verrucomicrobiaceae bacterium]|nr:MAG: hypothetical protein EOP83_17325 [Verrucomicrobiaceae bacterium]
MNRDRASNGFATSHEGLDVFRELEASQLFSFGMHFHAIGAWARENDYPIYLLYRETFEKNGVLYNSDRLGGFFMATPDQHVAFRMRWF